MRTSETQPAAPEARSRQDDAETFEVQQWRAMEQPKWNDARLDDLNTKVDDGFERMEQRFERMEQRFDRLMWSLLAAALAIIVASIGAPPL